LKAKRNRNGKERGRKGVKVFLCAEEKNQNESFWFAVYRKNKKKNFCFVQPTSTTVKKFFAGDRSF